ncbi:MAG: hypothetical protein ACM3O3_05175 [Syntrophothermus sp.]
MQEKMFLKLGIVGCMLATIIIMVYNTSQTISLLTSYSTTAFILVLGALALCIDFGIYVFSFLTSFNYSKANWMNVLKYGALCAICVTVSFVASVADNLNKHEEIKNNSIVSSDKYKRQNELLNETSESYAGTKKELSNLKENRNKLIKDSSKELRSIRDSRPSSHVSKKAEDQVKINKMENDTAKNIDSRIKELEKLESQGRADIKKTDSGFDKIDTNPSSGVWALAKWYDKDNPDKVMGWFNIALSAIVLILSVGFSSGVGELVARYGELCRTETEDNKKDKTPMIPIKVVKEEKKEERPDQTVAKIQNKIGFESEVKKPVERSKLEKYVKRLFVKEDGTKLTIGDVADGHRKIMDDADLSRGDADALKGYLVSIGGLKTDGAKTIIKMDMDDMLKTV